MLMTSIRLNSLVSLSVGYLHLNVLLKKVRLSTVGADMDTIKRSHVHLHSLFHIYALLLNLTYIFIYEFVLSFDVGLMYKHYR